MNIALWIFAALLAAMFLASGVTKILKTRERLIDGGYGWAEDFTATQVKLIGGLEILGAVGLIVPAAFGVAEIITPTAATGLTLLMLAAVLIHFRRNEAKTAMNPLVLGTLTAVVAVFRFGPSSF